MAHVEKYLKNQLGNMLAHYERSRNGANEHIDAERTCNNYNLAPDRGPLLDWVHKRLEGVKVQQRDDVKYMCDWIVTVPQDLAADKHKAFFEGVYDFCCQKYGEQNIISAYVHRDEATPHMHLAWVPVVIDKKKGIEKLSSKESLGGPKELRKFHTDLQHELEQRLECTVNILNGATVSGNKSIDALRRDEAQIRLKAASAAADAIENEAGKLLQGLQQAAAAAPVPADSFEGYWHDNWAGKWQHKQKIFGEDESRIEMDKADFIELFGDLEKYYNLAKDLAARNKALQEAIPQIESGANFLLKAGELCEHVAYYNQKIDYINKLHGKNTRTVKAQREELEQLRKQAAKSEADLAQVVASYKHLSSEHEKLKKNFRTVDSIADEYFDMLKKYPATMGKVLQSYANATGRDISYSEGGVCIASARCRVRELER